MTEDELNDEFKHYILEQKLCTEAAFPTSGDADDYLRLPHLTRSHREWLLDFIRRRDVMVKCRQQRDYRLSPNDVTYLRALVGTEGAFDPESRHLPYPAPDGLLDRLDPEQPPSITSTVC